MPIGNDDAPGFILGDKSSGSIVIRSRLNPLFVCFRSGTPDNFRDGGKVSLNAVTIPSKRIRLFFLLFRGGLLDVLVRRAQLRIGRIGKPRVETGRFGRDPRTKILRNDDRNKEQRAQNGDAKRRNCVQRDFYS